MSRRRPGCACKLPLRGKTVSTGEPGTLVSAWCPSLSCPRARRSRRQSVLAAGSAALLAAALAGGCSAASAGAASSAHSGGSATAGLPPPRPTVAHWGSFFGASKGIFDVATAPVTIKLPGTVAEVGTSNSTQYALLADGSLYAWGMGNAGQLGDGGTRVLLRLSTGPSRPA